MQNRFTQTMAFGGPARRRRKAPMGTARYTFDSVRSCIWVSGRSSLAPINTETRGISGWFAATTRDDGSLDLDAPVSGRLELTVDRLTSGNILYDRELKRRVEARRYPTIVGEITRVEPGEAHTSYVVTGDITFHGQTHTFVHEMAIEVHAGRVLLSGNDVFDIREFGMKPPSMLMVRVYPEIAVRVELHGTHEE